MHFQTDHAERSSLRVSRLFAAAMGVLLIAGATLQGCSVPGNSSNSGAGESSTAPSSSTPDSPGRSDATGTAAEDNTGTGFQHRGSGALFTFDIPRAELQRRANEILSEVTGTASDERLGNVHSLAEDEDLHFALTDSSLDSPVVCELMNALSIPPPGGESDWHETFSSLFGSGNRVTVRGVFRIWPDHAAKSAKKEGDAPTSNPPHILEVHPISGITVGGNTIDTGQNIAPITYDGEQYPYKDPGRWGDMLSHDVDVRPVRRDGRDYLEFRTPQVGFNYWELKARVVEPVTTVRDGHRFAVQIETPTRTYIEKVRCFTVAGSPADRDVGRLSEGSEATLAAIGRFDLQKLLAGSSYHGPIPVELCVFGINPPRLPVAARRGRHEGTALGMVASGAGGAYDQVPGRYRRRHSSDESASGQPGPETSGDASTDQGERGSYHRRRTDGERYQRSGDGTPYRSPDSGSGASGDTGPVIGNRRTHIYHLQNDAHLPAPANQVYFRSASEAEAAGYRPARE